MTTMVAAVAAGLLIGLTLGALGGGGSILAVPVLVYGFGQSAAQATTGSLVVVGITAVTGAIAARRAGTVLVARGLAFGLVAVAGAALGAKASAHASDHLLLGAFAGLMLVVASVMAVRQLRTRRRTREPAYAGGVAGERPAERPIITFTPAFACQCPRALKVVATATAVGLLVGFLGVGGGFLVVPALVLSLGLAMRHAVGTSLVVIAVTSAAALLVRAGTGTHPDWDVVTLLALASVIGGYAGARIAPRLDAARLQAAFTVLLLAVAGYTAWQVVHP